VFHLIRDVFRFDLTSGVFLRRPMPRHSAGQRRRLLRLLVGLAPLLVLTPNLVATTSPAAATPASDNVASPRPAANATGASPPLVRISDSTTATGAKDGVAQGGGQE
jgi:hypothetical protein